MVPQTPLVSILPKTLGTLRDSPPEYLIWKDGQKAKSSMRQLSVSFEDNMASGMNWGAIVSLKNDPTASDALNYCIEHPVRVGNRSVHILGITHSSDHSAEHVKVAVEKLSPATIALESCADRTQARIAIQLPLVELFDCDWINLTDLKEFGGQGPSISDLAKHGLLDGHIDIAQFMVASGSVAGCPELTALYEAKKRNIHVDSIDMLESIKLVQNASIDACGSTSRRPGDLSEGVLRQVVNEEGILSEYFRLMYGSEQTGLIQPSYLYRLIESRKRSPPFADLLLRELHRMYRPKQYWARIYLRDLYMSLRIRRLVTQDPEGGPILVVVGGAHTFGIREFLTRPPEISVHATVGLSCLLENAETLCDAWRDVLKIDSFGTSLPRGIENAEAAAAMVALSILSAAKVSLWVGSEWQVVELPPSKDGQTPSDRLTELTNCQVGGGIGKVDLIQALVDGRVDPYSVARMEAQAAAGIKE
jgi:hypothetical protein